MIGIGKGIRVRVRVRVWNLALRNCLVGARVEGGGLLAYDGMSV